MGEAYKPEYEPTRKITIRRGVIQSVQIIYPVVPIALAMALTLWSNLRNNCSDSAVLP